MRDYTVAVIMVNKMSYYTLFLPTCKCTSYCLPYTLYLAPSLAASHVSRTDRVGFPALVYS